MLFRLRVDDISPELEQRLAGFFSGKEHVLVKHVLPHGNPHFHAYLDSQLYMSIPSFRYQFDKLTGAKGPQRSIKECDAERKAEYLQYLFNKKHGNISTIISTTIDCENFIKLANEVAAEFEKANAKKKRVKDITTWDMSEEVRNMMLLDKDEPLSEYDLYGRVIDYAIDVCRKHKKTYTDFSILRIVQTAITSERKNRDIFKKNILDKIFRN